MEKKMDKRNLPWGVVFVACGLLLGCSAGIQSLKGPTGDESYLLVGSILFQNNYLNDRAEVYRKGIEVAILGRVEESGKADIIGHWTMTDENGYFFVADVQPGQYVVKGIRLTLSDGTRLVISSPLRLPASVGFQLQEGENIVFEGDHFPHRARGRIMNLEHNYFTIDNNRTIGHATRQAAQDLQLVTGERIDLPRVEEYLLQKYPDSGWTSFLKESLEKR